MTQEEKETTNWFAELKRRSVYRVAVAYGVVSWGLIEISDILISALELPDWTQRLVLVLLLIGLVPTLLAAWALELTPEGIKFERDVDRGSPDYERKGRKLNSFIIGALILIIGLLLTERFFIADVGTPPVDTAAIAEADRSVAVLPFEDFSQERDREWFADGISEEILNVLARTPDIIVASRTSSFAYKNSDKDVSTIGQELGVAHVLEGSVRSSATKIRITAQLIRVSDGSHVWSQNYDRGMVDIIDIQEDVAIRIASALKTTMDPEALEEMLRIGTRSVRAYQAYIRGLALRTSSLRTGDRQYFLDAYEQFELARDIDPKFSTAHRQAADFWRTQLSPVLVNSGLTGLDAADAYRHFLERIDLAVDTATNETERSGSRAQRATVQLRLRNAIRRFREYLHARPNDIGAWSDLLRVAMIANDQPVINDALGVLEVNGRRNRSAAAQYVNFAYRLVSASAAADYGLRSLERWPNDTGISYQVHRALLWAGRSNEARALLARIDPIVSRDHLMKARQSCADGHRGEVLGILKELRSANRRNPAEEWLVLVMLGEHEAAREMLSVYASNDVPFQLASWLVFPMFDPSPFPALVQMIERENIERAPPMPVPFACPESG